MCRINLMAKFVALGVLFVMFHRVEAEPYVSVGAGYKLSEGVYVECPYANGKPINCWSQKSNPITARIEVGYEWRNVRAGLTHHSQWFQGWPVNGDRKEYSKNELFVDYVFRFK